jgi:16S rRNA G966 N2-methylase RsmD
MQMIFDVYLQEEIEQLISEVESLLRKGYDINKVKEEVVVECFEELLSITKARMKNDKTKEKLYMTLEDLRFATHETVADYRASKLKCGTIIDVGCGIGLQSIAFSRTCSKVIAIEVDERKARYASENFKKLGIKNISLVNEDAFKAVKDIKKADIVFCDTERAAEETERSLSTLKPDVKELFKAYDNVTKDFCIEVPPQIKDISLKCEKEYVSLNGKLNRLNLYFGSLMKSEFSAVSLPNGDRVEGKECSLPKKNSKVLDYLYEVDEAIVKAGLLSKVVSEKVLLYNVDKQVLLTSDSLVKNGFFKTYKLIAKCKPAYNDIVKELKKAGAGSIILRAKVKPEDYWSERKKYESKLDGDKKFHLFIIGREALIAEPLKE